MARFKIKNTISGTEIGEYEAQDVQGAWDAMAREAGQIGGRPSFEGEGCGAQQPQKMATPKWQYVEEDALSDTDKLRIPGGWLYRHRQYHSTTGDAEGLRLVAMNVVFVPE